MTVYVDDVRQADGRMQTCHMWADTREELLAMADRIGVERSSLRKPPSDHWTHFNISLAKKAEAISAGALVTDKFGPLEFLARRAGDAEKLAVIAAVRARHALDPDA